MRGDRKWWGLLLCIPPCLSTIFCFIQQENIKTGWTHRVSLLYQHPPGFYSVKNSSLLWLEGLVCGPGLLLGKKPSPSCGNPDTKYRSNRFHWKHQKTYIFYIPAHLPLQIVRCLPRVQCWRKTFLLPDLKELSMISK